MGEPVVKCLKNFFILKYFIEYSFIFVEEVQNSVQLFATNISRGATFLHEHLTCMYLGVLTCIV